MYNTLVLPYFTYCSTVWNDGSSTILSKLSKLQRRAARVITGQTYDVRSTQILGDLSWIPIEDTLKRREIIMSFKALTDRLPTYLQELFVKCNNDNYYLRSNNSKLALPKPKTNFLKRSFSYRVARIIRWSLFSLPFWEPSRERLQMSVTVLVIFSRCIKN